MERVGLAGTLPDGLPLAALLARALCVTETLAEELFDSDTVAVPD